MVQYETTFIVDPVLSDGEINSTADNYIQHLKKEGCEIVHINEMGLQQLAYTIKKRNSGVYFNVEFQAPTGELIDKLELAFRRDERIMRFLTVRLDKYAVQYNQDKRDGKIGAYKRKKAEANRLKAEEEAKKKGKRGDKPKSKSKPAPKKAAPKKEEAPAAEAPVKETPVVETPVAEAPVVESPAKEAPETTNSDNTENKDA